MDADQEKLDNEDLKLRAARLERLYDEEIELNRKISDAKKTIRDCRARLTQNKWFIHDQIRRMLGKKDDDDSGIPC